MISFHAPTINKSSPPAYTIATLLSLSSLSKNLNLSPLKSPLHMLFISDLKNCDKLYDRFEFLEKDIYLYLSFSFYNSKPSLKAFPKLSTSALKTPTLFIPLLIDANCSNVINPL